MTYAVFTENLTKKFGDFTAVDNLSLTIEYGCIYGLLGSNGSGKSTTIRMLCGVLPKSAGTIKILGHDIHDLAEIKTQSGLATPVFGNQSHALPLCQTKRDIFKQHQISEGFGQVFYLKYRIHK